MVENYSGWKSSVNENIVNCEVSGDDIDSLEKRWNSLKDKFSDQSNQVNQMIQQIDALLDDGKNLISLMPEEEQKTIKEIKDKIIAFENGNYTKVMGGEEYIGNNSNEIKAQDDNILVMDNILQKIEEMNKEKLLSVIRELESEEKLSNREELILVHARNEYNKKKDYSWNNIPKQRVKNNEPASFGKEAA